MDDFFSTTVPVLPDWNVLIQIQIWMTFYFEVVLDLHSSYFMPKQNIFCQFCLQYSKISQGNKQISKI